MWRRPEIWLGAAMLVALAFITAIGGAGGRTEWADRRPSIRRAGPYGAKGLAASLRRFGIRVRPRERPLFDLARDSSPPQRETLLAFLDIDFPTNPELLATRNYVARGGRLFVAGSTGIEYCFGYRTRSIGANDMVRDSAAVESTRPGLDSLPEARRRLVRIPRESLFVQRPVAGRGPRLACRPLFAAAVDTLLVTRAGRPVALDLHFGGGGRVLLLADARYVANRALKETDAGALVLPWFLTEGTQVVEFDEYHLGDGGGSLWSAAGEWLIRSPSGWAILQVFAVALVVLATHAVRFGPALHVIERQRRSPLEHLEALAAGLQGAEGVDTAVQLIVAGLRRRLSRSGVVTRDQSRRWLQGLELASPSAAGRAAVRRLQHLTIHRGGPERVYDTAQAVEDVWTELRPQTRSAS